MFYVIFMFNVSVIYGLVMLQANKIRGGFSV